MHAKNIIQEGKEGKIYKFWESLLVSSRHG